MNNPLADLKRDVYTCRKEGSGYRVTKFNSELNPVSFYHLDETRDSYTCNCPQSTRGACRHQEILDNFLVLYPERIDSGWFYCHDTSDWFPPIPSDVGEAEAMPVTASASGEGEVIGPTSLAAPEVEKDRDRPPSVPTPSGAFDRRGL